MIIDPDNSTSVVAAGLSFNMLHSAIEDATRLYRARYLAEKHGMSWDEWIADPTTVVDPGEPSPVVDATVEVDLLLDEVSAGEEEPDHVPPAQDA